MPRITRHEKQIMDTYQLDRFDIDIFLSEYWQQKPVVLKQFFHAFEDPLDENDLAGLAQEPEVDARIISHVRGKWQVDQGPIENFDTVCKGNWTLLVQGVDKYIRGVNTLLTPFNFIPNWRLDDIMVSFATQGAGVGAHIDQYDVFLVQGKGARQWRVGKPGNYREIYPHPKLRQIEDFVPIIDEVLQPGDVLYVPPGWPHDGKTVADSLTYSVGYRAPDNLQLAESLAMMLDRGEQNTRFSDPMRHRVKSAGSVHYTDIQSLKHQLIDAINSEAFTVALLEAMSEQGVHEFPLEDDMTLEEIANQFAAGVSFVPAPGIRPLITDGTSDLPQALFVNGTQFDFDDNDKEWFKVLASGCVINANCCQDAPSFTFFRTLTTLINNGYWDWFEE